MQYSISSMDFACKFGIHGMETFAFVYYAANQPLEIGIEEIISIAWRVVGIDCTNRR
jgi:hypothetical protein